jgi:hypothetical protein
MKQRAISVDLVFESQENNLNRTEIYLMQALTTAFPGLRNATVALAIRDEDGVVVRTVTFGNPSEEMKSLMEYQFGPIDPPEAQPA